MPSRRHCQNQPTEMIKAGSMVLCLDFSHCDPEEFISRMCVSHRPKLVQNVVGLACKKVCVCVYIYVCETVFPLSGLLHRVFPSLCSGRCNWKELDLMGKRCIGRNVSLRWFLEQKLNPSQSQIDPNYIRVLLFFARNVGNSGEH